MTEHAAIPRLCDGCLLALLDDVRAQPELVVNGRYCPHHRAFAVVQVRDGGVVDWALTGPVSEADVRRTIDDNVQAKVDAATEYLRRTPPHGSA